MAPGTLPASAEIVVVGAGIAGLCSALYLARSSREVVVLEQGEAWGEASGANAGTLSLQVKRPEVLDLMQMSLELWEGLSADEEFEAGYARSGGLRVAMSERELEMLDASISLQRERGIDVDLLEGDALRVAAPWLGPEVRAASTCPQDAFSIPLRCGPSLIRAASAAGACIVSHAGVSAIDCAGGYCLDTAAGKIRCGIVAIAAGAWSGQIAAMLGVELPILVDVNMLTITEPAPAFLDRVVTHIGGVLSLKQYPNGTCMIGGGWQGRGGLESGAKELDYERLLHNLRTAAIVVPALAELRILRSWSGFEAVAADALPLLGRLPGHDRVFIAAGARGGYSLGPAQGLVIADLIASGSTSLSAERFDPARFLA